MFKNSSSSHKKKPVKLDFDYLTHKFLFKNTQKYSWIMTSDNLIQIFCPIAVISKIQSI